MALRRKTRWLCFDGHEWVHRHPAEARAMGLLG